MFDANKRKYPRANYPCQLTIWIGDDPRETILANTANIGIGGLCVHLNHSLSLETKVDINLQFADSSTPFKCAGTVVRCVRENEKYFNVGIQFEPLSELKTAFMEGKITEIMGLEQKGKS